MPQLDKVTFLSQFFWLCIVFFGLYLILVKHYLPALARIVLVRQSVMNSTEANNEEGQSNGTPSTSGLYDESISTSLSTFQSRTEMLSGLMKTQLQVAIPNLSPQFHADVSMLQEEVLVSQHVLSSVVPPINRENEGSSNSNDSVNQFLNSASIKSRKLGKAPVVFNNSKSKPAETIDFRARADEYAKFQSGGATIESKIETPKVETKAPKVETKAPKSDEKPKTTGKSKGKKKDFGVSKLTGKKRGENYKGVDGYTFRDDLGSDEKPPF
jgi:hypothetical protein